MAPSRPGPMATLKPPPHAESYKAPTEPKAASRLDRLGIEQNRRGRLLASPNQTNRNHNTFFAGSLPRPHVRFGGRRRGTSHTVRRRLMFYWPQTPPSTFSPSSPSCRLSSPVLACPGAAARMLRKERGMDEPVWRIVRSSPSFGE